MNKNKQQPPRYNLLDGKRIRALVALGALTMGLAAGFVAKDTGLKPAPAPRPLAWQYQDPHMKITRHVEVSGQDTLDADAAVLQLIHDRKPVDVTFGILVCPTGINLGGAESSIIYNPLTYTMHKGTDMEIQLAGYLTTGNDGQTEAVFLDPNNPDGPINPDSPPCYYMPNPLNPANTPETGQVVVGQSSMYSMVNPADNREYTSSMGGPLPIGVHQIVYPSPEDAIAQS